MFCILCVCVCVEDIVPHVQRAITVSLPPQRDEFDTSNGASKIMKKAPKPVKVSVQMAFTDKSRAVLSS